MLNEIIKEYEAAVEEVKKTEEKATRIFTKDLPNAKKLINSRKGRVDDIKRQMSTCTNPDDMAALGLELREYQYILEDSEQLVKNTSRALEHINMGRSSLMAKVKSAQNRMWMAVADEILEEITFPEEMIERFKQVVAARHIGHVGNSPLSMALLLKNKLGNVDLEELPAIKSDLYAKLNIEPPKFSIY